MSKNENLDFDTMKRSSIVNKLVRGAAMVLEREIAEWNPSQPNTGHKTRHPENKIRKITINKTKTPPNTDLKLLYTTSNKDTHKKMGKAIIIEGPIRSMAFFLYGNQRKFE
ncbi:hypothetical protein AVEN_216857-1 [Araneus ventricosus]|uniref:Uncharacterized protein n=1 Tax=Araneus ventricosus TaxID=182803 RepID=A0A4Y2THN5_ARAVE|nr:hypothetical protein AVEN_216857-1 [Araneus ventricosus]